MIFDWNFLFQSYVDFKAKRMVMILNVLTPTENSTFAPYVWFIIVSAPTNTVMVKTA